ncbi:hypothetical protein QYE76_020185 [Lolium multiflorum]|uniref:Uncharacterized protein n=1 Tax=Lolium multiflorum TaxID=4521 RepID=A0AAD8R8D5_LOLMU|nr:hypothetical protein QYE76_020185 [Lolium multiflorum]
METSKTSSTVAVVDIGEHLFKVEKHSLLTDANASITSETFCVGGHDWAIQYYPNGDASIVDGQFMSIYINLVMVEKKKTSFTKTFLPPMNPKSLGYNQFMSKDALAASGCLEDDCLSIKCTVEITQLMAEDGDDHNSSITVPPSNLSADVRNILESGLKTDLTVKIGKSSRSFNANTCVLRARSPVFREKLRESMSMIGSKKRRSICIDDIDAKVFEVLLHYIYNDCLPGFMEEATGEAISMARDLLVAAHGYGIQRLRVMCESRLSQSLDVHTAILGDGSVRNIEKDTFVKFEVEFSEMDAQELQSMEEKAVKNWVEKIGESVVWGPEQQLSLLRFDDWKGEYVRIEDGDDLVTEIDRRDGWTSKHATFYAEIVDRKSDSKVGYVASKLAAQIADDEWASQRQIMPIVTEVSVISESDAAAQEVCHGAANVVTVDWNAVELEEHTDLVIAPMSDIEMARIYGIPVDDKDKEKDKDESEMPANANRTWAGSIHEDVDPELMQDAADEVDDAHDDEQALDDASVGIKKQNWCSTSRRKRGEKGPPIVVDECWPTKKPRVKGCRKKRNVQILVSGNQVQSEAQLYLELPPEHGQEVLVQSEPHLDVELPPEQVEEVLVQSEPHLDVDLPPEQLQEDLVESEAHLDIDLPLSCLVKSEIQGRKVVLGGQLVVVRKPRASTNYMMWNQAVQRR